ncbi:MAG: hypothetical protein ACXACU_17830 [Candidatus Hodarchaeales archaeon]|jgi:hypothetical protein
MHETEIHSYPNLRTCTLGIVTQRGAAHDAIAGATQVLLQMGLVVHYFQPQRKISRLLELKFNQNLP